MNLPSGEEIDRLRAIFREAFGWEFGAEARTLFETRLKRRLSELSLPAWADYLYLLTYDRRRLEELARVADLLTTRETYFFREGYQLAALREEILPLLARESRPVSIWSAGCASGEEAYTVAMVSAEAGIPVEVLGTDVSPAALATARRGEYEDRSLRETPIATRDRWFERRDDRWVVRDELKRMVRFTGANLLGDPKPEGPFDAVLCRNVIIYFSQDAKRRLAARLWHAIRPGGWLLLGHAESLVSVSGEFELVTLENDLVYRRPASLGEVRVTPRSPAAARIVLIGTSTGGPGALLEVLSALPATLDAAVVVAIHMPPGFTTAFAERLSRRGPLPAAEAKSGELLRAGTVTVCPGGQHVTITRVEGGWAAGLSASSGEAWVPSVDRLFASAAPLGADALGVVLTGMGRDGAAGAGELVRAGGRVIVEARETAVVHGMPGAVQEAGVEAEALRRERIAAAIAAWAENAARPRP
jgi:chemotaxis protein methyltransferase CheR